jgi:hypothetical protein
MTGGITALVGIDFSCLIPQFYRFIVDNLPDTGRHSAAVQQAQSAWARIE